MINLDNTFDNKEQEYNILDYWVNNKIIDCSSKENYVSRRKKPVINQNKSTNKSTNKSKNKSITKKKKTKKN